MRLGSLVNNAFENTDAIISSISEKLNPTLDELPPNIGFDKENVPALVVGDNWSAAIVIDNIQLGGDQRQYDFVAIGEHEEDYDVRKVLKQTFSGFDKSGWSYFIDNPSLFVFPWSTQKENKLSFYFRVPRDLQLPYFGNFNFASSSQSIFLFPNQNPYQVEELDEKLNFNFLEKLRLVMPFSPDFRNELMRDRTTKLGMQYQISKRRKALSRRNFFGSRDVYGASSELLNIFWVAYRIKQDKEIPVSYFVEQEIQLNFPNGKIPGGNFDEYAKKRAREVSEHFALPIQIYQTG